MNQLFLLNLGDFDKKNLLSFDCDFKVKICMCSTNKFEVMHILDFRSKPVHSIKPHDAFSRLDPVNRFQIRLGS